MKLLRKSSQAALVMLGCASASCAVDAPQAGSPAPSEPVGQAEQHFNVGSDPNDVTPIKGHVQITRKALALLQRRNLLPPLLQNAANQALINYGDNFADHSYIGRPEAWTTPVPNRMSQRLNGATAEFAQTVGTYTTNVESWLVPDPTMTVKATTTLLWTPGTTALPDAQPNYAMHYHQWLNIYIDLPFYANAFVWDQRTDIEKDFTVDNIYHYSLGDVKDFGDPSVTDDTARLRLFPVSWTDDAKPGEDPNSWSDEQKDATHKIAALLTDQTLASGVDFGNTKYGAMLYQLARKFFIGSAAEPDLNELQRVGNTVPGWHTGSATGKGGLDEMQIAFPHTFLGGNPHVCAGSDSNDPCETGSPTWPVWVPDSAPTLATLDSMEVPRPGRSDRVALIYLGWALHMMQDASVPHHVANWTGAQHEVQDAYGDDPAYYAWTSGKEQFLMDNFMAADVDALLGTDAAPKTRDEICNSLDIVDGQLVNGDLNWSAVRPAYLDTAKKTFALRQPTIPADQAEAQGAEYVKNAILGSMKLLLCATPSTGYSPTTAASGFVWAGDAWSTAPYQASSSYSYNSSGGISGTAVANTITRLDRGAYQVDFPGLGQETGGNVQVTAYGGGSERCKVQGWGSNGTTLSTTVLCHDTTGAAADAAFTASYVRKPGPRLGQSGGYLWADQPWSSSYTPDTDYQWNSTGARNTIDRWSTGSYSATFPGVDLSGGTVEVTAYGSGSEYCTVSGWSSSTASVNCFDTSGAPADTQFTLDFTDQSPTGTPSFAYAWADQPSASSYTPSTFYQKASLASECSSAGTVTMQRSSTGLYSATIPGLSATGSTVKVTAYGWSNATCKVTGWGGTDTESDVGVACFDPAGNPIDATFVLVYSTNQYIIC